MKLNELKNMSRATEMPIGKNEVTFKEIQYREDRTTGDINGIFVHIEEYSPVFIPFFDNGQNFQLDLLLRQLDEDSYDPEEINKHAGKKIVVHRYVREEYTNTSFNANYKDVDAEYA